MWYEGEEPENLPWDRLPRLETRADLAIFSFLSVGSLDLQLALFSSSGWDILVTVRRPSFLFCFFVFFGMPVSLPVCS